MRVLPTGRLKRRDLRRTSAAQDVRGAWR